MRYVVSRTGLLKGYWAVVDTATNPPTTLRVISTKSVAQAIADGYNRNGPDGISGQTTPSTEGVPR